MQRVKDGMISWGVRGYTRFLKLIGDIVDPGGRVPGQKLSDRFWITATQPLDRFNTRIGH